MKMLITGSGFIGKFLMENFSKAGHSITGTYRTTVSSLDTNNNQDLTLMQLDLGTSLLNIGPADIIIHTAAVSPDDSAMPSVGEFVSSNIQGTLTVAEYAKRICPRLFVYLSTISVYGKVAVGMVDETTPINRPDIYGATKFTGEVILQEYARFFPTVVIRMPGVVGQNRFKTWLGQILLQAQANKDVVIYNPGSLFNNVIDVSGVAQFLKNVIAYDCKGFDVVTIAASEPVSVYDAVDQIITPLGSRSRIIEREGDRNSFAISIDKAKQKYHFAPLSTRELIRRYVSLNMQ